MGKGDHRGKNRAKLAKAAGLPSLAPVKSSRKKRGGDGRFAAPVEDPRITALDARCRHNGMTMTAENRRIVSAPAYEGQAQLAIHLSGRDAEKLLSLWQRIDRDHAAYMSLIVGRKRFPNVAKMEYLPEALEARPDDTPDPRSLDERIADAKLSRKRWVMVFKQLGGHERVLIDDGLWGVREYVRGGKITTSGQAFVAAVRVIHGMVER